MNNNQFPQPQSFEDAVAITKNAGLKAIDDYIGFAAVQDDLAREIASSLYEPDEDYEYRLQTYEYAHRSSLFAALDERELVASNLRLTTWAQRIGRSTLRLSA